MAYWQWGNPQAGHVVLCVHGLSRQGRDFDVLAQALCAAKPGDVRVICPDVVGRGKSDWLEDPMGYQIPVYAVDMLALINCLAPATLDWVGTSMGGLIGIGVCGQQGLSAEHKLPGMGTHVRRLVLNDVGPVIEWSALQRIGTYLGMPVRFESVEQASDMLRNISATFGPHTPAQWLSLSRPMVKPADNGTGYVLHYDPSIALPFRSVRPEDAAASEATLWHLYDAIKSRTLLIRGAQSDLLSSTTALAMTQRGPQARLVEFDGVGHAPTFVPDDQVKVLTDFLLSEP